MPRSQRIESSSGFYHATMRGNAKGIIYECDEHRSKFLQALEKCKDEFGVRIIAWCLMDNHVHMIIDVCDASLTDALHWVGTTYACYFNHCEDRVGHLFQCPFGSVPINYESQLINIVKYIHLNPERAGICAQSEYRWSSYKEYAYNKPWIADVDSVLEIAGGSELFLATPIDFDQVARVGAPKRPRTDEDALKIVRVALGDGAVREIRYAPRALRNSYVYLLKNRGLSCGQIARLCALSERTIRRVLLDENRRIERVQMQSKPLVPMAKRN